MRVTPLLIVPVLLLLAACSGDSESRDGSGRAPDEVPSDVPAPGGTFEIPARIASVPPIRCQVVSRGSGMRARDGDIVALQYTGMLDDGTVFDTTRDDNLPFEFTLGRGQVVKGWDMTVARMRIGDRWTVRIPSVLAYGERGYPGAIPPHSDLTFDMELVRIR